MSVDKDANHFGRKLNWLKGALRVTDSEIGAAVHESASLVCRWRSGQRSVDRIRGGDSLVRLADFFAKQACQRGQAHLLARALSVDEAEMLKLSAEYRSAFIDFMYSASPVPGRADPVESGQKTEKGSNLGQACFIGMDGLLASLDLLEKRLQGASAGITVYLSLEHSRILRETSAAVLWERLWRLSGETPIRLIFDNWADADEAMKTLRGLLPFMQNGRLQLYLIKSTQKFFYSNISFYADGVGMVITAEPAGGLGDSVSMFVESPDYIKGMGGVFTRFDKNIKPVEKHLSMATTKDEAIYFARLFERGGDIRAVVDGMSLIYMDSEHYMKLLKINSVTGSQRAYRLDRFLSDKRQFEAFLEEGRVIEIFSLPALDNIIKSHKLKTPDFSFLTGPVRADRDILRSLIGGMLDCLKRSGNLSMYLTRRAQPHSDFTFRLKADSFVLLHSYEKDVPHAVWSDTWLLVYEYIRQFDESIGDGDLITTKDAVLAALKIRLENLGGTLL